MKIRRELKEIIIILFSMGIMIFSLLFATAKVDELTNENNDYKILIDIYSRQLELMNLTLHDPTFDEMMVFLNIDKTNEREYIQNIYVCKNFANDFIVNASLFGLRCAFVTISYKKDIDCHAVVAFNVTGRGLVYIEPQSDKILDLNAGGNHEGHTVDKINLFWNN